MMKTYITAIILAVGLTSCAGVKPKSGSLILPNPKLLGCSAARCPQLWKDDDPDAKAIYPKQLTIDFKGNCAYGLTAKYDKFTPIESIRFALDKDFGKWAVPHLDSTPVMVWRVEPEKFAIQLGTADDGMQQLIYLSLRPELR
jgi:hypothetical protein